MVEAEDDEFFEAEAEAPEGGGAGRGKRSRADEVEVLRSSGGLGVDGIRCCMTALYWMGTTLLDSTVEKHFDRHHFIGWQSVR